MQALFFPRTAANPRRQLPLYFAVESVVPSDRDHAYWPTTESATERNIKSSLRFCLAAGIPIRIHHARVS
jgi:hypothetical protein